MAQEIFWVIPCIRVCVCVFPIIIEGWLSNHSWASCCCPLCGCVRFPNEVSSPHWHTDRHSRLFLTRQPPSFIFTQSSLPRLDLCEWMSLPSKSYMPTGLTPTLVLVHEPSRHGCMFFACLIALFQFLACVRVKPFRFGRDSDQNQRKRARKIERERSWLAHVYLMKHATLPPLLLQTAPMSPGLSHSHTCMHALPWLIHWFKRLMIQIIIIKSNQNSFKETVLLVHPFFPSLPLALIDSLAGFNLNSPISPSLQWASLWTISNHHHHHHSSFESSCLLSSKKNSLTDYTKDAASFQRRPTRRSILPFYSFDSIQNDKCKSDVVKSRRASSWRREVPSSSLS